MAGLYRVESVLGRGAYATVCVARRTSDGERVALKVLRLDLVSDISLLARMRDEARLLSTVTHPDIVKVWALREFGVQPVLEMEYVDGASLARIVRDAGRPVPTRIALEIVRRTALALDEAYRQLAGPGREPMRIIHRDIKPDNLLITRAGDLRIVDFGIAKAEFAGRSAKTLGVVSGSAGYEAPERRLGVDSPATDVFGLGVTLFVLATTKTLVLARQEEARAADARRQIAHVGTDLADPEPTRALLDRMVAARPGDRPSAREVADAIAGILAAEGPPDLAGWAAGLPWEDKRVPATEHPEWENLRFLETATPNPPSTLGRAAATAQLRRLLASGDWPRRLREIEQVLCSCPDRVEAPLIAVLKRARPPWWQFWARPSTTEELEAALWVLADRPSNAVLGCARELVAHPSPSVSRSAKLVLERARPG